jgi:hypothetical protein
VGIGAALHEARQRRNREYLALKHTQLLKRMNAFGWNEGTQTHLHNAPGQFEQFLMQTFGEDPETGLRGPWSGIPTWLVDTGDLTTWGDGDSTAEGKTILAKWATAAQATAALSLYGNHDAWPACMPFTNWWDYFSDLKAQRDALTAQAEWQPERWVTNPLSVPLAGLDADIELYGLDSIGWSGFRNGRAVGQIDPRAITHLQEEIESRRRKRRSLRILATHHPISFPYGPGATRTVVIFDKERLSGAQVVASRLRYPPPHHQQQPYVQIMLSGHVHARYPAERRVSPGFEIQQQGLDRGQLSLTASSLMLPQSGGVALPPAVDRLIQGFSRHTLDFNTAQADVLRFHVDLAQKEDRWGRMELELERIPVISTGGTSYELILEEAQTFNLHF